MNCSKKLFGVVMITLSLVSVYPEKVHALDGGAGYVLVAKEYGLDALAWYAANRVIKKITAQTVNWINSGFQGNPAYVTNPEQFFLDVGDNVASQFLSNNSFAMNNLCSPFRAQVRLALVKNYLSDNQNYACTLTKIKNNYDQFTRDFSQGGWDSWFEVTQNNQNNPYGAYMDARDQLSVQIGTQQNKYQQQLAQGRGFLSFQKCPKGGEYFLAADPTPKCSVPLETVTPGSVIESQLNETLSGGLKRLEAADEIDEIIAALLDQLISKALGSVGGLFGSSQPDTGGRTFTTDLINDTSDQPPDRAETDCTTSPEGVDENGNPVPGVTTCTTSPPPPPSATCTTAPGSVDQYGNPVPGVMTCVPNDPGGGGGSSGGGGGGSTGGGGGGNTGTGSHPDPGITNIINAIKSQLGNTSGVCGAFSIVKEVAKQVGAGVLATDFVGNPNYCQGFSADNIIFSDGQLYDILIDTGNGNGPRWSYNGTTSGCNQPGKNCRFMDPNDPSVP